MRSVCDVCVFYLSGEVSCGPCYKVRRRRRAVVLALLAVISAAGIALGLYTFLQSTSTRVAVVTPQGSTAMASVYGTEAVEAALKKEPCDRNKIRELTRLLARAEKHREVVVRAEDFIARCGDYPALRFDALWAHRTLSEWDAVIADASMILARDASDYVAWAQRGRAYEEKGDLRRASAELQQALTLSPHLADVPMDLARIYERMRRPCEAVFPLEHVVREYPHARDVANVRSRIRALRASPECTALEGSGRATLSSDGDVVRANARINGGATGAFVVDTGASFVTISEKLARKIGLAFDEWPTAEAQTAHGLSIVRVGTADVVEVQGLRAKEVDVAVTDDLGDVDGLLGMSFLSRFSVRWEPGTGKMIIEALKGT